MQTLEQAECPVVHTFCNGEYIRELTVKAGVLLVGQKHKHEHINIFLKGKIMLLTGEGWKLLEAPQYFIGKPSRKIAYVVEDMTWLNVHRTDLTDINEIENYLYDMTDVPEPVKASMERIDDIADFHLAIKELGFTPEEVERMSNIDNVGPFSTSHMRFKIDESPIQGRGIFATTNFKEGDLIGLARIGNWRTVLGRYTNHAKFPNAEFRIEADKSLSMYAIKPIKGCQGSNNGDEIVIDYRQAFKCAMESL